MNWFAPTFDGGRSISHYIVHQDGMEGKEWIILRWPWLADYTMESVKRVM